MGRHHQVQTTTTGTTTPKKAAAPPKGGKGKGGKGKGGKTQAAAAGVVGAKRHAKLARLPADDGIKKPELKRLGARVGLTRFTQDYYPFARGELRGILTSVLRDACIHMDYDRHKTLEVVHLERALRRRGRGVY